MNKNPSQKNENMLNPIHKPLIAISTGCLKKLAKKGKCVIVVSHSNEVKKYADKILLLDNGQLAGVDEQNVD